MAQRAKSQHLSRRGLFSAFGSARAASAPQTMAARLSAPCLEEKGVGCRRCPEVCDAQAISFTLIGRGQARPALSSEKCVGCGACVDICPVGALTLAPRERAALIAGFADLAREPSGAGA